MDDVDGAISELRWRCDGRSTPPNMDALAREGLMLTGLFTAFFFADQSHLADRTTPVRHGFSDRRCTTNREDWETITLAELLSEAGYVTQAVGKWHLGENLASQPQNVGFDHFTGFLSVRHVHGWRDIDFYPEIALSEGRTQMMRDFAFENTGCRHRRTANLSE